MIIHSEKLFSYVQMWLEHFTAMILILNIFIYPENKNECTLLCQISDTSFERPSYFLHFPYYLSQLSFAIL